MIFLYLYVAIILTLVIILVGHTLFHIKEKKEKNVLFTELVSELSVVISIPSLFFISSQYNLPIGFSKFLWTLLFFLAVIELVILISIAFPKKVIGSRRGTIDLDDYKDAYQETIDKIMEKWTDDRVNHFKRKTTHIIFPLLFVGFIGISILLSMLRWLPNGISYQAFSVLMLMMIGSCFFIMFIGEEWVRIFYPQYLPSWSYGLLEGFAPKENELDTIAPVIPLIAGIITFVFAPFYVFFAVYMITFVADAMACYIGILFGRHKFRKESDKTIEGYIAGSITAFAVTFLSFQFFSDAENTSILIISSVAGIAFFLVDSVLSRAYSDNYLNPMVCGFGIVITMILLGVM